LNLIDNEGTVGYPHVMIKTLVITGMYYAPLQ